MQAGPTFAQDNSAPPYTHSRVQRVSGGSCGNQSASADQAAGRLRREVPEFHAAAVHLPAVHDGLHGDQRLSEGDHLGRQAGSRSATKWTRAPSCRRCKRACKLSPHRSIPKAADAHDQLTKERDAAKQGAALLTAYAKPANSTMSDDDFAKQKKPGIAFFDSSAGFADLQLKDYPAAIEDYKAALAKQPGRRRFPPTALGVAYLASQPPQTLDGFLVRRARHQPESSGHGRREAERLFEEVDHVLRAAPPATRSSIRSSPNCSSSRVLPEIVRPPTRSPARLICRRLPRAAPSSP